LEGVTSNSEEFVAYYRGKPVIKNMFINELLKIPKKVIILDIGCGIGNLISYLKLEGYEKVLGFDIDERIMKVARAKGVKDVFVGDARSIPIRSKIINYALCYSLIEHTNNPRAVLREILRLLKDEGLLYISVPNGYSINDILLRLGGKILRGRTPHLQQFSKGNVMKLLETTGFEIIEIKDRKGFILFNLPVCASLLPSKIHNMCKKIANILGQSINLGWELKAKKHS